MTTPIPEFLISPRVGGEHHLMAGARSSIGIGNTFAQSARPLPRLRIKSINDKVSDYIPDLKGSVYDDVTIKQLLTMTSGVKWNEDYADPKSDVALFNSHKAEPSAERT